MANLFKLDPARLFTFLGKLDQGGVTVEMAESAETNPDIIKAMVVAGQKILETVVLNPFIQTVEEQITALRLANEEEGWGISDEVIEHLAQSAPAWPRGRDSYRSLRIRFGEGDEGVIQTLEAHIARIGRVFIKDGFWRWPQLLSDTKHLRLLAGNQTHKPVIEWIIVQLDANRKRKNIEAVRGPNSLADEGLVLAWLCSKRTEAINFAEWSAWFLAYEIHVPLGEKEWLSQPVVYRCVDTNRVSLLADRISNHDSGYSVPVSV
jgi:hypothetical protein